MSHQNETANWTKFDESNEDTYLERGVEVLTYHRPSQYGTRYHLNSRARGYWESRKSTVTHWRPVCAPESR